MSIFESDVPATATSATDSDGDADEPCETVNPWPQLEDLFRFVSSRGNSHVFACKLCVPKETLISAYTTSHSNLRKHVKRRHPASLERFNSVSARQKRKAETSVDPPAKQVKLSNWLAPRSQVRLPSQDTVNSAVLQFIAESLLPLSVVEQDSFKQLFCVLQPAINMPSRYIITAAI